MNANQFQLCKELLESPVSFFFVKAHGMSLEVNFSHVEQQELQYLYMPP